MKMKRSYPTPSIYPKARLRQHMITWVLCEDVGTYCYSVTGHNPGVGSAPWVKDGWQQGCDSCTFHGHGVLHSAPH